MSRNPSVAIIVLNWNGWEDTKECLTSLRRLTYPAVRVYAVDNGSTDGSPKRIASDFPEVNLIQLNENLGFSGGMNAGIEGALRDQHDHILCMNNDMLAEPGFLEPLVAAAGEDKVVPYPALFLRDDPHTIDALGNRVNLMIGTTSMIAAGSREIPAEVEPDYTEIPLLSRELLETVGKWREEYFVFYEDADLGMRIQRAGWKLRCVPEAKILHRRGSTATRVRGIRSYYSIRNRLLFVKTFGSWWHYTTTILHVTLLTIPYIGAKCLLVPAYKHSFRHILWGFLDGFLPWRRRIQRSWQMDG